MLSVPPPLPYIQNFNDVFLDHISRCEQESAPVEDEWFRISLGRFKTLGRKYYRQFREDDLLGNLQRLVFEDIDTHMANTVAGFAILPEFSC